MPEEKALTLSSRITTLMIIVTILLIASFTAVQLNNQLKAITDQNIYQSKLSGIIVKKSLEEACPYILSLQNAINSLKGSGVVKDVDVVSADGKIVASTNKLSLNKRASTKDITKFESLSKQSTEAKLFYSSIDKKRRILNQLIPLSHKGEFPFMAKTYFSLGNIGDAMKQTYLPVVLIAVGIICANIFVGIMLSKIVIGPIKLLNSATKEISGGKLELRVQLPTNDELEDLADTFNDMAVALIKMKERAENANPLTKLPGNNVIHEQIEERIKNNKKFVVVYSDLDNFKAFNDKYGIGAGDNAIKLTARIMQESLKKGSPDDFLGHEGGDDFVLITTPEKTKDVTDFITSEFDKRVRTLFDKEDLERGYIVSKDRDGNIKQFPIMTVSLAGVTNAKKPLASYAEVTNICAVVKKKSKMASKEKAVSSFLLDEG